MELAEARRRMAALFDEGTYCPCCQRWIKRYKRKFNSGMARSLIWLVRNWSKYADEDGFVNVPSCAPRDVVRSREFDKLRWFGCCEVKPNEDVRKRCSGLWKPTERGIAFARCKIQLPMYAYVLKGNVESWSEDKQTIVAALGNKFDYGELMGNGET